METFLAAPWIVWAIFIPLTGAVLGVLWPRSASVIAVLAALSTAVSVSALVWQVVDAGALRYALGGWGAPLGIDLYADGLSAVMLATTALVGVGITLYATRYFSQGSPAERSFWPLWLFLWTALNALFLSGDLFNLYVTLELLGLAAVALVALAGNRDAVTGAMRYLLVSLLGSLAYLLGVGLLYGAYGTLDIAALTQVVKPEATVWVAMGLMMTGLLLKTALFPLHFWLPPAHAAAPAPASALLSALVVKASFYLLMRLWLDVFPVTTDDLGLVLGLLGTLAILWGSWKALRQVRLKLLVAYSTVAQLGYLFLAFPLALTAAAGTAWNGVVLFIVSHALAKAAMFLAAGNILRAIGHDRIADFEHAPPGIALSWAAFGVAAVSIIGLPPSAGFSAKWLLLEATFVSGQWWWVIPILGGGVLAAAYMFKVLAAVFTPGNTSSSHGPAGGKLPRRMEWIPLFFSLTALLIGFATPQIVMVLESGAPFLPPEALFEAPSGGENTP